MNVSLAPQLTNKLHYFKPSCNPSRSADGSAGTLPHNISYCECHFSFSLCTTDSASASCLATRSHLSSDFYTVMDLISVISAVIVACSPNLTNFVVLIVWYVGGGWGGVFARVFSVITFSLIAPMYYISHRLSLFCCLA